jgi:hypothetical protein
MVDLVVPCALQLWACRGHRPPIIGGKLQQLDHGVSESAIRITLVIREFSRSEHVKAPRWP